MLPGMENSNKLSLDAVTSQHSVSKNVFNVTRHGNYRHTTSFESN